MLSPQWKEYFITVLVSVLLALFVRSFVITAYRVPTGSMQPTLKAGDFIFSYRLAYGARVPFKHEVLRPKLPERGDLVVFSYVSQPDTSYVKRIVALPGDKVEITKGNLVINDMPLDYELDTTASLDDNPNPEAFDVYLERDLASTRRVIFKKNRQTQNFGPLVVAPGEVFVLGDNRDASDDSRYWGAVPIDRIYGKVLFVWLSLDWQRRWAGDRYPTVRWDRVFSGVH